MLDRVLHPAFVFVLGEVPAAPVIGVMAFGLIMAMVGHMAGANKIVGMGIAVLFLATAAMVLFAYKDYTGGGDTDPRPKDPKLPDQVYQGP